MLDSWSCRPTHQRLGLSDSPNDGGQVTRSNWRITLCAAVTLLGALAVTSCYTVEVDSVEEWCAQITGEDLYERAPFWAAFPGIRFLGDSIRADYGVYIDEALMEQVDSRADRMAWVEGTTLHIVNVANLLVIEHDTIIGEWRTGIERATNAFDEYVAEFDADRCFFGGIASLFDTLVIHSAEPDGFGWGDEWTTVILTERRALLDDPL